VIYWKVLFDIHFYIYDQSEIYCDTGVTSFWKKLGSEVVNM